MLPSRGLRPAQFVPLSSRQSTVLRCSASRKFSSLPRTAGLSAPSCRTSPLQAIRWRAGATGNPHVVLTASSVRFGSWYAPWSSGKASSPAGDTLSSAEQVPVAEYTAPASHHVEPVVTSTASEVASAHIEKAPVVDTTTAAAADSAADSASSYDTSSAIYDLLETADPVKRDIDPTALIEHGGQLKELGLDYGWGMTTIFERTIEQIYLQSGMGWAGSIMVAGVVVRCATFFLQAMSSDKMAAMASMKPLTAPIQEKLDAAIARGDKQQEQVLKMQQAQILAPYMGGIFSMGGFMLAQAWIGFSAFRCLRAMSSLPVPGMANDGYLWFTDLTVRDPYCVLPVVTTALFYTIFKTGGETGISQDMTAQRQKLMTAMAFVLGAVTLFQPAGLQLYFLTTGVLGAFTGYLLRQNGFRRAINIRPIPSKESTELYTKVVKGEVRHSEIKAKGGKIQYQAPRAPKNHRTAATLSGINVKAGTDLPAHLKPAKAEISSGPPDRDADFEEGAKGTMREKLDYYRRNYRLAYISRRMGNAMKKFAGQTDKGTKAQQMRKKRAEEYEIERRRRFENRK